MTISISKLPFVLVLAAVNTAGASQNLKVAVSTDCSGYNPAEPIMVDVRITNISKQPVVLYGRLGWGMLGSLSLHIKDSSGKEVQPKFLDHDLPVPSTFDNPSYQLTLHRGHYFGITRHDSTDQLFSKPGTYTLQVSYHSPVLGSAEPSANAIMVRKDGNVVSDPVVIVVGERTCHPGHAP